MDMVVEHYRKYLDTPYEGGSLPGVYHRYVGHDNNRDFITLTQSDTQVISRLYSVDWYPHVLVEKHQMGSSGPRYFVPPNHDPIAENVDEGLWSWSAVFGSRLAHDMTADGLQGVAQHWLFDDYWPGSTETSLWKNVISFLTEAASCKVALPIFVEPTELRVRGKGLSEYKKSVNMTDPWPGGWWRLGDIVSYEISSLSSILRTAARNRVEILRFRNDLCRKEVEKGRSQAPFYFVLPQRQIDRGALPSLIELLLQHGVRVYRLTAELRLGGKVYEPGDVVVPLAQPYRAFVKEVMEAQRFPVRHYTPGGEIIRPYDITSWSLPLHRGLRSDQIEIRSEALESALEPIVEALERPQISLSEGPWALAYPSTDNDSYAAAFAALSRGMKVDRLQNRLEVEGAEIPAGSFLVRGSRKDLQAVLESSAGVPLPLDRDPGSDSQRLRLPRIALVETYLHDMDAGWTRYVFDQHRIPFAVVRPGDFATTDFAQQFDVVVFPDSSKETLFEGKAKWRDRYYRPDTPPEFRRGIGEEGQKRLMSFVDQGGIVVAWRRSTALFLDTLTIDRGPDDRDEFELPIRDLGEELEKKGLLVPGALLAIELLEDHPLTWGMPPTSGVFSRGTPVLKTSLPELDMDRRVVASFPEEDLLLSGYVEGEELLARSAAMVWLRKGRGQLVLYAFYPQFRGSTPATYKLLFNALLLPRLE
jgi:hypothetical protein